MENKEATKGSFWSKHGPNMVEYLILAGIMAIFWITWGFKNDIGSLQSDANLFLKRQEVVMIKVEKNNDSITNMKANHVSRNELSNTIGRIERGMDRMEDKLEKIRK